MGNSEFGHGLQHLNIRLSNLVYQMTRLQEGEWIVCPKSVLFPFLSLVSLPQTVPKRFQTSKLVIYRPLSQKNHGKGGQINQENKMHLFLRVLLKKFADDQSGQLVTSDNVVRMTSLITTNCWPVLPSLDLSTPFLLIHTNLQPEDLGHVATCCTCNNCTRV